MQAHRIPVDSKALRKPTMAETFFEVPMIGGMATFGRWFINRGMRSGTAVELHDHVITVYGGTGDWNHPDRRSEP